MDIPILMYHSVSAEYDPRFGRWAILPGLFEEHLAYLLGEGYSPLAVGPAARAIQDPSLPLPDRPVVVTFDDGFLDFYENALPLLARYGVPATLYITAGYVGRASVWLEALGEGQRTMMEWDQVAAVAAGGVEIGAHSLNHFELDTLSREDAWHEIAGSKRLLEERLGIPVNTFAYPHGYHDRQVRALVVEAGYNSACAVKHAMSSRLDDPFALARIIVPGGATAADLGGLLAGRGVPPPPQAELLRTWGWRQARRLMARLGMSSIKSSAGLYGQEGAPVSPPPEQKPAFKKPAVPSAKEEGVE